MKKLLLLIPLLLGLSSCEGVVLPTDSTTDSTTSISVSVDSTSDSSSDIISESTSSTPLPDGNNTPGAFSQVRKASDYVADLPSTGDQKILVLPIKFKDSNRCDKAGTCSSILSDINKTFFGKSEDTGWESVSSYYQKSSYGKLNITGKVSNWITLDKTVDEVEKLSSYADPTMYALRYAINQYKANNSDISDFDQDGDGYIDMVWMVYDEPYDTAGKSDILWAYVFWDYTNPAKGTKSNPIAYTYAWASYDFMYDANYAKGPDGHTFIHETGHGLGLDDYYNYSNSDKNAPAGGLDMMDYNIGDHNAFSKFLLDWVDPVVLKTSQTINLRPFESTGDCALIPANSFYNNSIGEYLIIEFYTPTGLNYQDSIQNYTGSYPKMFTIPGIKIYHADGRAAVFNSSGYFVRYDSQIVSSNQYFTAMAHSNTKEYSVNPNFNLLHLLEKSGTNTFKSGKSATNATLFVEGDTFNPLSTHKSMFYYNGTFNDGTKFNFELTITSIDDNGATIEFVKKS